MKENSSPYIASSSKPTRERVGLILDGANSAAAVKTIVPTETAGVRQVWMVQSPFWPDVLTTLAADALIVVGVISLCASILALIVNNIGFGGSNTM